jgi:hypothetical protein
LRSEHHFPDIDDPQKILDALIKTRGTWDDSLSKVTELSQFNNRHVSVHHLVNKGVVGTQSRDFVDKKVIFWTSDVDPSTEDNEIYMWVTAAPDEILPVDKAQCTRAYSVLGVQRIGRRKNGLPGCYLHAIVQTDVQVSYWTQKLLYPIMPRGVHDWSNKIRSYLTK